MSSAPKRRRVEWEPGAGNVAASDDTSAEEVERLRRHNDSIYEMLFEEGERALDVAFRATMGVVLKSPEAQCIEPVAHAKIAQAVQEPGALSRQQKIALIFCTVALFDSVKMMFAGFVPEQNRPHFESFVDQIVLPAFVRLVKGQPAYDLAGREHVGRSLAEREICAVSGIPRAVRDGRLDNTQYVVTEPAVPHAPLMTVELFVMLVATRYPTYCFVYHRSEPPEHARLAAENAARVLQ